MQPIPLLSLFDYVMHFIFLLILNGPTGLVVANAEHRCAARNSPQRQEEGKEPCFFSTAKLGQCAQSDQLMIFLNSYAATTEILAFSCLKCNLCDN